MDSEIRTLLREDGRVTSRRLAERTGLTRQALHAHFARALAAGWLVREGAGRGTRYRAGGSLVFDRWYETDGLAEDEVARALSSWLEDHAPRRSEASGHVIGYTVSELVNNAIDHSASDRVRVSAETDGRRLGVRIADEGIGAFENLRSGLDLDDHLHALQELSKGKATTMPERHTGEGIFFSSKLVARFELSANGLAWIIDQDRGDQVVREVELARGTLVVLEIDLADTITPQEIFERYASDFEFDSTRCVVRLFEFGTEFVSRSEAKRLLANLTRFREVVLDFAGVRGIGQGFADEVFRVWARAHPNVRLVPENMNAAVEFMVRRGLARGRG